MYVRFYILIIIKKDAVGNKTSILQKIEVLMIHHSSSKSKQVKKNYTIVLYLTVLLVTVGLQRL